MLYIQAQSVVAITPKQELDTLVLQPIETLHQVRVFPRTPGCECSSCAN
jgi:hypothetical protein